MDGKKSRVKVGSLVCGQDKLSLIDELSVVIYGSFDKSLLRMA